MTTAAKATRSTRRTRRGNRAHAASIAREPLILASGNCPPAAACRPVRLENGVPVYRFRKQVIRLGRFTTTEGQPFEVTPNTLRLWLSDFHRMQRNGVPVLVPNRHDATGADENHGFVVGMELSVDGSGLDAIMELFGTDAPKIAASNHCSIYAEPGWTDGNRNQYRWPIRHVALTPDPRITGLKGSVPVVTQRLGGYNGSC